MNSPGSEPIDLPSFAGSFASLEVPLFTPGQGIYNNGSCFKRSKEEKG